MVHKSLKELKCFQIPIQTNFIKLDYNTMSKLFLNLIFAYLHYILLKYLLFLKNVLEL